MLDEYEILLNTFIKMEKIHKMKENFNSTFSIIHLSDLHIVAHSGDFSVSLHKMIDHICEVTKESTKIIIVFTGDLVEKGDFKNSEEVIYNFFKSLYDRLKEKIVDIVFTPGNHDKMRGALLLRKLDDESDETFWKHFKESEWNYFSSQFHDYIRVVNKIRTEIFGYKEKFSETYGVQAVKIDDYKICFLKLNSAWLCMGKNDEGNLRVGRFQLEELRKAYQDLKDSTNLVIALMHHPTEWLTKEEQKYLNQYMTDEYRLNTNIMLQGHIHEKETYNWYNQSHSLTTLVTGMGWDQQREIKDYGHRYSMYEINMESSIVRVNTFVSDSSGKFIEDTELYKESNIIFPLFVHKYLEINKLKFQGSEYPLFYPDYNVYDNFESMFTNMNLYSIQMLKKINNIGCGIKLLKQLLLVIRDIMKETYDSKSGEWLESDVSKILEQCQKSDRYKLLSKLYMDILERQCDESVKGICGTFNVKYNSSKRDFSSDFWKIWNETYNTYLNIELKDRFYEFIGGLCMDLQTKLFKKECFDDDSTIRIHFRILDNKQDEIKYKKLFSFSITKKIGEKKLTPIENTELSEIVYENSMIEKSFKLQKALLFSMNPSSNSHNSAHDWIDFLTYVPQNTQNVYVVSDEARYPYISFGISVNSVKLQNYMRELTFLGFDKVLTKIIQNFFDSVRFDIKELFREERF